MKLSTDTTTVAFIGLGVMGSSMARNLLQAGYNLVVHTRTPSKAQPLLDAGATWAATPGEAAKQSQVTITMVGYPQEVEDLWIGDGGIVDNACPGSYLIDMSTSSPTLARELHAIGAVNDLHVLDCPVTGGDIGAREARLTIFVGGEKEDLEEVSPVLDCMGETISYQGIAGMGQMAKLANQIALAGAMLGATEAIAFARQTGLSPELLVPALQDGTAGSFVLENLIPRALAKDYSPGFFVKHFIKDMGLALDIADELELTLPGLETAYQLYDLLSVVGGDSLGTQALALIYEDEKTCAEFGLDWSRADDYDYGDDDFDDDDDCGDPDCDHDHGHAHGQGPSPRRRRWDDFPGIEGFFSEN